MRHSLAQLLASPSGSGTPRLEPGASSSPSPCSFPESPEEAEPRHEAAFLDDNELELELELLEALVDYPDLPTSKASSSSSSSSSRPSHRLKAAAAARLNRQKKKQYVSGLETRLQSLAEENRRLRERNRGLGRRLRDLERETGYLRAVLANQSALGRLLGRLAGGAGLRIRSSLFEEEEEAGERPFWESSDHDYALPVPEEEEEEDKMGAASVSSPSSYSSGICLHVDQDQVSVEFCSVCSRRAAAVASSSLAASSATAAASSSSSFFASKIFSFRCLPCQAPFCRG